jgi:hypothetical protein
MARAAARLECFNDHHAGVAAWAAMVELQPSGRRSPGTDTKVRLRAGAASRVSSPLSAGSDRWDNARRLALVNAAIADGFIAGFDARYVYEFWRPVTAIRAAVTDGNDATGVDATWETYLNTPPIPDYPSTHSVGGGAASAVLARFFGKDDIAFQMTSGLPFAGITRFFNSFSQAAKENADSRVYAGIHFRSACRDGIKLGEQIGRRAFAHFLQPYRE